MCLLCNELMRCCREFVQAAKKMLMPLDILFTPEEVAAFVVALTRFRFQWDMQTIALFGQRGICANCFKDGPQLRFRRVWNFIYTLSHMHINTVKCF
jgi:hypothetical protein